MISKEFIIRENPQLFILPKSQFGFKNESTNNRLAKKILTNKNKILLNTHGTEINSYRVGKKFIIIDEENLKVLYYLSWFDKYFEFLNTKVSVIKMHWKDKDKFIPSFNAKNVFFNYLLPMSHTIMSSGLHTDDSKSFWLKLSEIAINDGLFVYYIDFLQNNFDNKRTIRLLDTVGELLRFSNEIDAWGESNKFQAKRLLLTANPLTI